MDKAKPFSITGLYAMATAEHREPCDSRGSCTVLGAPGGEILPGDSSNTANQAASVQPVGRSKCSECPSLPDRHHANHISRMAKDVIMREIGERGGGSRSGQEVLR